MYIVLYLLGIFVLGSICSYTDIKNGKIYNKHIKYGIYYSLLVAIVVFFTVREFNFNAFFHYITNSAFVLVVGFLLWYGGLWTAGDAKFFFVINLLFPPDFIYYGYKGYFYGFTLFTNIFIVLFFYFLILLIKRWRSVPIMKILKESLKPQLILTIFFFIFALGYLSQYLPSILTNNFFITIMFYIFVFSILSVILGKYILHVLIILSFLRVLLQYQELFQVQFYVDFVTQLLLFFIARFIILKMSYYVFTKKRHVSRLKVGDFIAEDILPIKSNAGEVYTNMPIENLTFFAYIQNQLFAHIEYDKNIGIKETNLNWFRKNKKKLLFNRIRVYETMPFAPFIFVGVILTIVTRGDFFIWLVSLIISI